MTIRVVIVDDSATMRAILKARLSREPDITVVGTANNAAEGRALIRELDPDVVTLDIEMPGMNGLDFLEKIMKLRPTPVIVVSGATREGTEATVRALALGAVDCYAKGESSGGLPTEDHGKLAQLIREAGAVRFTRHAPRAAPAAAPLPIASTRPHSDPALIAIGSSTGGIEALQTLLGEFPADCPPTVIVQHVNNRFVEIIAANLDRACPAHVCVAEPDLPLLRGHVYLSPGGRHMRISGHGPYRAKLREGERVCGHMPSVDVLFDSVAATAGAQAVGVLLTGMGSDGARGLLAMAEAGGATIAQDEASCIVFGMPRAAIALGAAQTVAPITRIAGHIFGKKG